MSKFFSITHSDKNTSARSGILKTDHGEIETPFFMPIATYGAVKTQSSNEIKDLPGFNGDPFRLSNTMGMQRVIAPPMD